MKYHRITEREQMLCQVKVHHDVYYYALQLLENEIEDNLIQYRQPAVKPYEYSKDNMPQITYYICRECKRKLPKNYGNFCPNCGTRLREPKRIVDEIIYNTPNMYESIVKQRNRIVRGERDD